MTVQDLMIAIYEGLDDDPTLCPYTDPNDTSTFDITTAGAVRLLKWINRAYRRILSYKFPDGTQVRFEALKAIWYLSLNKSDLATVSSGSGTSITISDTYAAADYLKDVTFKITDGTGAGQTGIITASTTAGVLTIYPALTTDLDSTSVVTVYPRNVRITDDSFIFSISKTSFGKMFSISQVIDYNTGLALGNVPHDESLQLSVNTFGEPTSWFFYGDAIHLSSNVDSAMLFKIEYQKLPAELSAATDEPSIPEGYSEVIVMYGTYLGKLRGGMTDDAYSLDRYFDKLMATTKSELETSYDRVNGQIEPEVR